ncbi:MAG: TonB-dependent receptor [Gammaproteobacteria bacterium]|jgi:outer membrane receptor protein involved in Fe transport|nr:TonB-dependent receptor [Gammaproteobacteria bacterium]MDH3820149.1 TonB-dependent receptor [Gammaproteobacteria bacterium]MDH3982622.1 TonB-dependent receptor [Gammaproteobacteria bacterium]
MKSILEMRLSIAVLAALFSSGQVLAQDENAQDTAIEDDDEVIEQIIVTGSRLRRDSFNVSTPLVVMDTEAIQDTGLNSLAEVLIDEMPAVFEGASNTNGQSYVNATGLTTMSLRNQGTDRTLVLIDGRRTVPNQYSSTAVSLNTIPTALIQRVEVITGGSSAAYGSDAIAGVVNIITQQDKVGLAVEGRYGATSNGGGEEFSTDLQYGTKYANDRGYLFFAATYDDQQGIGPYERDRARIEAYYVYDEDLMCNAMQIESGDEICMRDIVGGPSAWRNRSDGIAGGVFEEGRGNGGYWYDENNVFRDDWLEERDGIHTQQFVQLKVPEDRWTAALKTTYDFENNVKGTFQVMYAENNSFNDKSPEDEYDGGEVLILDRETLEPGTITPGRISPDNPFVPQAVRDDVSSNGVDWERRMFEVGHIQTDNNRTTLRGWAALQGEFGNDWQWDVSIGYGKSTQTQLRYNEINVVRERQALDAEYAEDGVTIQCADPEARAAGCVPLNIFGVGSITPEMADWLRVNPTIDSDVKQQNLLAFVSGDLFEMRHGPVPVVFGIEYRKDELDLRTDEGSQYGGITFNLIPSFAGDIDVWEAFTEMAFPLTETFSAEISARIGEYSPSGISTVFSATTGLMWEPVEGYKLRANFARAQRAPTIAELYSPPRGDYDSYNDICEGTTLDPADSPGRLYDNCRLEPGIMSALQDLADAGEEPIFPDENTGYGPAAGNPDVFEETADTWTVGFSINPGWADGLRLAVDYWDISIEDKITEIGNSEIMAQCYDSSQPWGPSNPFCNEISRNADDGQIYQIMNRQYNLDSGKARGLDLALNYVFELGSMGDFELSVDWTRMFEDSDTYEGLDGLVTVDFTGQLDYGNFDDRVTASLTWRYDDWRVRWNTKYKSSVVDHNDRVDDWNELRAENDALCAANDPGCITNPEAPMYLWYPSYTRHDIAVSYLTETQSFGTLRFFGGVKNIFDDMGPFIPTGGDTYESGPGNFDSKFDGGVGRFWFLGAEVSFD